MTTIRLFPKNTQKNKKCLNSSEKKCGLGRGLPSPAIASLKTYGPETVSVLGLSER